MERMKEIEIFGIPALFTEKRIDHDAVYPGMYRYELETVNNGPKRVSDTASGTFLGTVLDNINNDLTKVIWSNKYSDTYQNTYHNFL